LTLLLLACVTPSFGQHLQQVSNPEAYKLLNAGQTLLQQEKYEEACIKFKAALALDPHNSGAQVDLGGALIKMSKFDEALPVLKEATKDNPSSPEAWLNLATAYQSTGNIAESIVCLKQFLKLAPHHEYAPKVRSMIVLLEEDQKRRAAIGGSDQGADYLADAVQSGTIRFAKERMPLRIYIAPGSSVPGFKPEYDEIVRQAFVDWQESAPNFLSFKYVPSATDADITVTWTNDPTKMVSSAEGGHAEVVPAANGILKSDITILTSKPGSGGEAGSNYMRHVVLHEVGHALGIFGHSPKAGDVMYGIVMPTNSVSNLSDRDKQTMLALYSASGSAVHPVDNTHIYTQGDDSSPEMKLIHLNNQAGLAMKNGNFTEAQAKFEQAMKIDPNNFGLKQNLGALYCNLGSMCLMKRDFAGAESYLKKAIPILQQSPDKGNLKTALGAYSGALKLQCKMAEAAKIDQQLNAVK
jgi:tetratricopeptide (TPR) repeat protein